MDEIRINLMRRWFNNIVEGKKNDSALLIHTDDDEQELIENLNDKFSTYKKKKLKFTAVSIQDYPKIFENCTNLILIAPKTYKWEYDKRNNPFNYRKFIVQNDSNLIEYILDKDIDFIHNTALVEGDFEDLNDTKYYAEIKNPYEIIIKRDTIDIYNFVDVTMRSVFSGVKKVFFDGLAFDRKVILQSMRSDIDLLVYGNILTARLATILYRVSVLRPSASVLEAGRYFSKNLGKKSKTLNAKVLKTQYNINSYILADDLINKNFKAYDLFIIHRNTRMEIAEKLLELGIGELHVDKIAFATGLTAEDIKNIQDSSV